MQCQKQHHAIIIYTTEEYISACSVVVAKISPQTINNDMKRIHIINNIIINSTNGDYALFVLLIIDFFVFSIRSFKNTIGLVPPVPFPFSPVNFKT